MAEIAGKEAEGDFLGGLRAIAALDSIGRARVLRVQSRYLGLLLLSHLLFLLILVDLQKLVVQSGDMWHFLAHFGLAVVLAELDRQVALAHVVVERTDVEFVAAMLVTHDSLVLVGVVEPFHGSVALSTFDTFRTIIPAGAIYESFAVLRRILENVRRSSEISRVMRVVATLGVVGVLLGRAPARLVVEHEEDVAFLLLVQVSQVLV